MAVQENYRDNPFHNFRHCFCVTQMVRTAHAVYRNANYASVKPYYVSVSGSCTLLLSLRENAEEV